MRRQTTASASNRIICLFSYYRHLIYFFVVVKYPPALPARHADGGSCGQPWGHRRHSPCSRGRAGSPRGAGAWVGCRGRRIPLRPRRSRARFAACREGSVRRAPRRAAPSPLPPGGSGQGRRRREHGARFAARGSSPRLGSSRHGSRPPAGARAVTRASPRSEPCQHRPFL